MTAAQPAPGRNNSKLSAIFHFPARAAPVCPGPLLFLLILPLLYTQLNRQLYNSTAVVSFKFRRRQQSYDNVCSLLLLKLSL